MFEPKIIGFEYSEGKNGEKRQEQCIAAAVVATAAATSWETDEANKKTHFDIWNLVWIVIAVYEVCITAHTMYYIYNVCLLLFWFKSIGRQLQPWNRFLPFTRMHTQTLANTFARITKNYENTTFFFRSRCVFRFVATTKKTFVFTFNRRARTKMKKLYVQYTQSLCQDVHQWRNCELNATVSVSASVHSVLGTKRRIENEKKQIPT